MQAEEALGVPPGAPSRAGAIRLAEALGASRLVSGGCALEGNEVTLSLRLLDVERASLSGPLVATGPLEGLPDMILGLAWDIALAGPARPSRSRDELLAARAAVPFPAFRAYARGLAAADPASRVKDLERALALAPGYEEALLALGQARLEGREPAAALDALNRVGAATPLARPARFLEGVALLKLGRYRDADRAFDRLAAAEPTPAVLNNRAIAMARLGTSGAASVLRQAVEKEPSAIDLCFNLGWALLLGGDAEAAAFWLRGVTYRDPRDAHARVLLTWALRRSGREAEAAGQWRELVRESPSYEALATPDLARRFERVRLSERLPVLDAFGRADAETAAAHLARAETLAAAAEWETALGEATRAAYLDPYAPRAHALLARIHRARGEGERAAGELRMSLWCRDDPAVRLELAGLLLELGRAAEARAEARTVLKADPGNAEARRLAEIP
jgi:tetratricopeptide (TPR) repeat protein